MAFVGDALKAQSPHVLRELDLSHNLLGPSPDMNLSPDLLLRLLLRLLLLRLLRLLLLLRLLRRLLLLLLLPLL